MEIDSLAQFIYEVKGLVDCKKDFIRFYRGQSIDKPLIPNTFRKQCFVDNESEMYNEIVNKKPEEFSSSKCTFDHLVKMQHYNIPTRLLDVTTNPLVALYFACNETSENVSGKYEPTVYFIDIPTNLIKNYNSDSVTILSSLARYDKSSKEILLHQVEYYNRIRKAIIEAIINWDSNELESAIRIALESNRLDLKLSELLEIVKHSLYLDDLFISHKGLVNQWESLLISDTEIKDVIRKIIEYLSVKSIFSRRGKILKQHVIHILDHHLYHIMNDRLLHEVKQDKPYFRDLMHINTFNTIYCVKPRLDNPRIIKQNGAFLIFPHAKARLENNLTITKMPIDKLTTTTIKDDLSKIDINGESLFNDMDTVCLAIKSKYEKRKS